MYVQHNTSQVTNDLRNFEFHSRTPMIIMQFTKEFEINKVIQDCSTELFFYLMCLYFWSNTG